jgi:ABC-type glycerol-3-phosphate transport system substrate-binding protein
MSKAPRARRVTAALSAALLISALLTACGGGGASGNGKTLTMWVHTDPNYQAVAKKNAADYEAATGVHVNLTFVSWDQYGAKIASAFKAGSEPDLIQGVASWLYAQKTGGQLSEVPADLSSQMSGIAKASRVPVTYKHKYYGVPLNVNIDTGPFSIYNVEAFKKAGVTPTWTDWDSYVADLQKLTTTSNGTITRSGIEMMGGDLEIQFLTYFLQAGGQFYSPDGRSVQIDNKYGEAALQTMYDLLNTYKVDSANLTDYEGVASGTAASINYGPWYTATLKADFPDFKWGWAKLPLMPNAKGPYFPGTNVWAWMVPAKSPNASAAWKYVRWLNDKQRRLSWAQRTGEIPAVKALWRDPSVANDPRWAPWLPVLHDQVPLLYLGPQDVYQKVLTDMVNAVLRKQTSISQGLKSAEDQLNQMLAGLSE